MRCFGCVQGEAVKSETFIQIQTPTSLTVTTTMVGPTTTAVLAGVQAGLFVLSPATSGLTATLPTGAAFVSALQAETFPTRGVPFGQYPSDGDVFSADFVEVGSFPFTLTGNTGVTIVPNCPTTVSSGTTFKFLVTSVVNNTYSVYGT